MNSAGIKFSMVRQAASLVILASLIFSSALGATAINSDAKQLTSNSSLTNYTTDLTQLGREGRLQENLSFEIETLRLLKVLAEGGIRQPVIVDQDSAVQDAIVEQAALRIAKSRAPKGLADRTILKVETAALFSNARSRDDAAKAIDAIVSETIASNGRTILYIDELSNFVGHTATSKSILNGIAEGKLVIIGGCSAAAYDEQIASQPEIAAYFTGIKVAGKTNIENGTNTALKGKDSGYRGDNVSPDLRKMMAKDPSGRTRVDVILQARDADNAALRAMMADGSARVIDRIGRTDTLLVNLPLSALSTLSTSGLINYASPNRPTTVTGHVESTTGLTLMRSQPASGDRPAYTLDGSGVGIAVLDSGIYAGHNGFKVDGASRIVANVNFTSPSMTDTNDGFGHGTHVAGLAVGSNGYNDGAYRGVANNANIISVKVLDNNGTGQISWLLDGLDGVLQNRAEYNIRVVNLSLGTTAIDSYTNDPICVKVRNLSTRVS